LKTQTVAPITVATHFTSEFRSSRVARLTQKLADQAQACEL
jgi:hypothetical protein